MRDRVRSIVYIAVGILIAATTIALLVLRIERVREEGPRTTTKYNLKLCAEAIHGFHDTYRRLPDAFAKGGEFPKNEVSLWVRLLPFVESDNVHRMFLAGENPAMVIPSYNSPDDPHNDDAAGKLNFAANLRIFGLQSIGQEAAINVGVGFEAPGTAKSGLTLARITGGASNVIMLTTRYSHCGDQFTEYVRSPNHPGGGFFGAGAYGMPPSGAPNNNDLMFQSTPELRDCNHAPGIYGHAFGRQGLMVAAANTSIRFIATNSSPRVFARAICPDGGFGRDRESIDE